MSAVLLVQGEARALPLRDESMSCCVTSPPYWSLRDYNVPNQIGLEKQADCLAWARQAPWTLRPDLTEAEVVYVYRELKKHGVL